MAALTHTAIQSTDAIIATFGEVTETNDRIARLEVRPGMREGQLMGLALRRWGNGHWCSANGQPSYFTSPADASAYADRWIETGRDQ